MVCTWNGIDYLRELVGKIIDNEPAYEIRRKSWNFELSTLDVKFVTEEIRTSLRNSTLDTKFVREEGKFGLWTKPIFKTRWISNNGECRGSFGNKRKRRELSGEDAGDARSGSGVYEDSFESSKSFRYLQYTESNSCHANTRARLRVRLPPRLDNPRAENDRSLTVMI